MAGNISLWCFMISSLCINNSVGVHVFMTVFQPRRVWLTDNNSMLDQHWKTQRRTFAASGSHNYLWPGTTYFMNTQITNLRPEAFRVTCSPATRFTVQITGVNRDKMVTITELDIKILSSHKIDSLHPEDAIFHCVRWSQVFWRHREAIWGRRLL